MIQVPANSYVTELKRSCEPATHFESTVALVVESAVNALSLLRVGPVSGLQDFHSMPTVHPTWLNVNSVFGRFTSLGGFSRLGGCFRLNNDDGE